MLLTADWHLTDTSADDYRWDVFDHISNNAKPGETIYVLGDLTDRKDRHSATLVNRLVDNLMSLVTNGLTVHIIMGNHDAPLRGDPFWKFLSLYSTEGYLNFHVKPHEVSVDLLLLPWVANPREAWESIQINQGNTVLLSDYKCIFMHQPISGAYTENGRKIEFDDQLPIFPRGLKIYSGDIHTPQLAGRVQYVGAPHPVQFGDTYPCRLLRLNEQDFSIAEEIILETPRKLILNISSVEELQDYTAREGDQVRVRFTLPDSKIDTWALKQDRVAALLRSKGVTVASIEATVDSGARSSVMGDYLARPEDILRDFAKAEGISEEMLLYGTEYLEKANG